MQRQTIDIGQSCGTQLQFYFLKKILKYIYSSARLIHVHLIAKIQISSIINTYCKKS